MKKLILLFIITLLFSCNNEEKHHGDWIYNWSTSTVDGEIPSRVSITNDSIRLRYPYFDYWSSLPINLSHNKIEFSDFNFKTKFIEDTLVLNQYFKLFKSLNNIEDSQYLREDDMVNIDLPKLDYNFDKYKTSNLSILIRYGKRIDDNEYALNLNDKYAEFKDLFSFLRYCNNGRDYDDNILLFCDRDTKLNDVKKCFHTFNI